MSIVEVVHPKPLDPDWKMKLTSCLSELGFIDKPCLQLTVNVTDRKVSDLTKQTRYK